jgi:tetratricopeptide (TPR) repeat protein
VTRLRALDRVIDVGSQTGELRAELDRIDQLALAGRFDELATSLLELANNFHYAGYPHLVLAAVADLRALVPPESLPTPTDAWALNFEALGQSALGNEQRSGEILERMLARGRELDDAQIISTALQNLGVRALIGGDPGEAIRLAREAYGMKRDLGDDFAAAQILLNLATALQAQGELDEAERILTESAPLITRVGDSGLQASLYGGLGQLQCQRGEYDVAEENFREALRAARKADDLSKQVIALQNLGSLELDRGQPGGSLRWYRKALRLAETSDAPPQLELIYRSLAMALHRSGRDTEAASALEEAQEAALRFDDDQLRAGALADLAALRALHGHTNEARAMLAEALQVLDATDDRERQVAALRNLAVLETQAGETETAIAHLDRGLLLAANASRETRSDLFEIAAQAALAADQEGRALTYLLRDIDEATAIDARQGTWRRLYAASVLRDAGSVEQSLPLYEAAAASAERLADDQLAFDARNDRATALAELDRLDDAATALQALVGFAQERANRVMEQQAIYNLGEVTRRRGHATSAALYGHRAVAIARALADMRAEVESLCNLGLALADAERVDEARQTYRDAERLAHRGRLPLLEARAISGRAGVAFLHRRYAQAAGLYQRAADISTGNDSEHLGDLAGLLESLSAAGKDQHLQRVTQELVDVAQRSRGEADAVFALTRSASRWLARDALDEAASLFAVAFVLGAVAANMNVEPEPGEPPITEEGAQSMLMPAVLLVTYGESELGERSEAFYEQVFTILNDQYEGIGQHLRFVLDTARDVASPNPSGEPRDE